MFKTTLSITVTNIFSSFKRTNLLLSAGITETLPCHVEGWFLNKLNRLKTLSEIVEDSKSKQHSNKWSSTNWAKDRPTRKCQKRVIVSVINGNIPLENIVDLGELDRPKSENTPSLVAEMSAVENCSRLNRFSSTFVSSMVEI